MMPHFQYRKRLVNENHQLRPYAHDWAYLLNGVFGKLHNEGLKSTMNKNDRVSQNVVRFSVLPNRLLFRSF